MNRETRRLSKIPEQVRQEVLPFYLDRVAIAKEQNDVGKIDKLTDETAERIRSGLAVSTTLLSTIVLVAYYFPMVVD